MTKHSPQPTHPHWQDSCAWWNRKEEILGIGAVFYRDKGIASFLQKKRPYLEWPVGYNTLLHWHEQTQALPSATGVCRAPTMYIWRVQDEEGKGILLTEDSDVPWDLPSAPMVAEAAQAPVPSQHCQESWVPQGEAANLGWDLLGFNSKCAWVNTRLCPFLRLSFIQTTPSFMLGS